MAAVAHDNWLRVTGARPLNVGNVRPNDDVSSLKYIGPMMSDQLNAQNVNTLQDLINTLAVLANRAAVDAWLQAVLTNATPYACTGLPQHGRPYRYYVRLVNKFAYNSIVTWLDHWWTTPDRYFLGPFLPRRPGRVRRPSRVRYDKVPPLLTDRTAAQAFPPNCAPPLAAPIPAPIPVPLPPPPPPAPIEDADEVGLNNKEEEKENEIRRQLIMRGIQYPPPPIPLNESNDNRRQVIMRGIQYPPPPIPLNDANDESNNDRRQVIMRGIQYPPPPRPPSPPSPPSPLQRIPERERLRMEQRQRILAGIQYPPVPQSVDF